MKTKTATFLGIVLLLLLPVLSTFAATEGDDFDDNGKDPARWGSDITYFHGKMTETNGRLEYTTKGKDKWNEVLRPWIRTRVPYSADWTMQIEVTNTTSLTANGQWANFGIGITSPRDYADGIYTGLFASTLGGLPMANGIWAELDTNWDVVGSRSLDLPGTSSAIKMAFDSLTKVVTLSYALDIPDDTNWMQYASFGLAGSGGANGNTDWGLADGDSLPIFIYGYSEKTTISGGQLYGDNFLLTGSVTPAAMSVYEGTMGTTFTVTGSYFGDQKGKVLIGKKTANVVSWGMKAVTCSIKSLPAAGTYDVTINPKTNTTITATQLVGAFSISGPRILSVSPDHGSPNTEITITGSLFGTSRGTVYMEYEKNGKTNKKACSVTQWTMDPATGESTIKFRVPKGLDPVSHPLYVTNKVGKSAPGTTFTVDP